MDLLNAKSEASALEQVCKIFGHKVAKLTAYSETDFIKYCQYISSIDSAHDDRSDNEMPLCIHISTHGNCDGVGFGRDFLRWRELFEAMKPIFTEMNKYKGSVFISISSCEAGNQQLDRLISREWKYTIDLTPPEYIFTTSDDGGVTWDDALVSWTVFYHRIANLRHIRRNSVKSIIDDIKACTQTNLSYFRWDSDESKYLHYNLID